MGDENTFRAVLAAVSGSVDDSEAVSAIRYENLDGEIKAESGGAGGKESASPACAEKKGGDANGSLVEMVRVEGGTFTMGDNDSGSDDESPEHEVTVRSFLMGKTSVTQAVWELIMGSNPSRFKGKNRPVECVRWYDVVEFCNALSEREGLTPCYTIDKNREDPNNENEYGDMKWTVRCDFSADGYRLPTEAEWEFAARGGTKSQGYKYSGSNDIDEVGWYKNNSRGETHDVGLKKPNELGIYDMSGNVWEWCWDWSGNYDPDNDSDPVGSSSGCDRVDRGGGWSGDAGYCRVADRSGNYPGYRIGGLGFRLVRSVQ